MASIMGLMSLLIALVIPVMVIVLAYWIYQIKRNTELQVEQNNRIIELLEKGDGKE
ncbi:hypothetical protein [Bacillus sp. FJAT-27245]|uniref:hypothetical protein n=1 Tax=Bacillus sp. FJAT-27245 TaxID=1684144 RepID=UPI000A986F4A|nr:hypothetical protein [Bacillus sp. FJAT-27245]